MAAAAARCTATEYAPHSISIAYTLGTGVVRVEQVLVSMRSVRHMRGVACRRATLTRLHIIR